MLERIYPGLDLVKDYGWLTILAKPLYWLLDKLHGFIGNWGWSIMALVLIIKVAFYWLQAKGYESMAKMKAINPKVMQLRERYKDNPQQMQQEMMRIYREEKVNPLGGCLPIMVQIPVFIALYWVLLSSVEMRNAPWIGWIRDLSTPDPYFILPVMMTLSTMLQTALNPVPPDPMQAKMMWFMPLIFSVMFFFFPAGLVLYWITNNVLSIAQQWLINVRMGVPPEIQPAEVQVGAGRSRRAAHAALLVSGQLFAHHRWALAGIRAECLVDETADQPADDGRQPEQPQLLQGPAARDQRGTRAACGIDRGVGHRDRDRWISVSASPIAIGAKPEGARLSVDPMITSRKKKVSSTPLDRGPGRHGIAVRRVFAVAVGGEHALGQVEAGAAGDVEDRGRCEHGTDHLGRDVEQDVLGRAPAGPQADRHGRIEGGSPRWPIV